jgi:hypothetical protein
LDFILHTYYKPETGELIVPEKWKNFSVIDPNKLPAATPRELLKKKLEQFLTRDEWNQLDIY